MSIHSQLLRRLFVLGLVTCAALLGAQQRPLPAAAAAAALPDGFAISWSPLTMVEPRQRFTAGVMYTAPAGWAYLADVDYGNNLLPQLFGSDELDYRLRGAQLEVRREVGRNPESFFPQRRRHYFGLRVGVRDCRRVLESGGFYTPDMVKIQFEQATQQLRRYDAIATYTLQVPLGARFSVEGFTGLGLAYRDMRYVDRIGAQENDFAVIALVASLGLSRLYDKADEGTHLVPAGRLGLRVSYLLN